MSGIRNLGGCPCPRCKITLSDVHLIGTKRDRNKRLTLARQDDVHRQHAIYRARAAIYNPDPKECLAVDSAYVERLLKPESLVPTSVSSFEYTFDQQLIVTNRMHSLTDFQNLGSMFLLFSLLI